MSEMPIDPLVAPHVRALQDAGVETFESCQGGPGHASDQPMIRFFGDAQEGYRAIAVALDAGIPVASLNREWPVIDGELTGPYWRLDLHLEARP